MKERIREWIDSFVADSTRERDDIHLDRLDDDYRPAPMWLNGALAVLSTAERHVRERSLPVTVAVEMFLREQAEPVGLRLSSLADLAPGDYSWTPPALTIYRHGTEPWNTTTGYTPVELSTRGLSAPSMRILFQEWYDGAEGNYDQRLWLVAV
jgi:hypothetical protein